MLESWIAAAAKGITSAVLDKVDELWQRETVAGDSKTDADLLQRFKEKLARMGANEEKNKTS